MRISETEVKRVLKEPKFVEGIDEMGDAQAKDVARNLTTVVSSLPDREDRVAEIRERLQSGEYHPSSFEIVESMVRRAIADGVV